MTNKTPQEKAEKKYKRRNSHRIVTTLLSEEAAVRLAQHVQQYPDRSKANIISELILSGVLV